MEFNKELRPKVGIGVYITDGKGNLLMTLRKGSHAFGTWAPPGGHLENGESFLDCCRREVKEEVGLDIGDIELLGVVNNVFSPEKHYVNIDFFAKQVSGKVVNCEPEKFAEVIWADINNLPTPLMLSSINLFKLYPGVIEKLKNNSSFKI